MVFLYVSTADNKLSVVQVEDETGNLIKIVQTIDPIVDPLPPNYKSRGIFRPATEWVEKHPKYSLLYAFTSFLSSHQAYVTTYRINEVDGTLEKLGSCETGGLQVVYAAFSPDASILCIAHHNDGNLSFFDTKADNVALEKPVKVVETPEVRPETRRTAFPGHLPSLHHVCYAPNGQYLLTGDCSAQGRVWTYAIDERGLVTSERPVHKQKMAVVRNHPSASASIYASLVHQAPHRLRRIAVHPNGNYVYILYETHNVIQVYEITPNGKIIADCLQEIPCIDASFFDSWKPVGLAINGAGEMVATEDGIWVSNRGSTTLVGRAESSLRFFAYEQGGARLVCEQTLEVSGPVRHFLHNHKNNTIYSGVNKETPGLVETFRKQDDGTYQKTGQAAVGMDVMCIAAVEERSYA
jgi:6-phosphogluconolactonase (cycloisomerase 2 family)